MSASRKLYVAMAKKLKASYPEWGQDDHAFDAWNDIVIGVAEVFHQDNAGFDRVKFLKACGFTDEGTAAVLEALSQ